MDRQAATLTSRHRITNESPACHFFYHHQLPPVVLLACWEVAPTPTVAKGLHVEREEILESPSHETLAFLFTQVDPASCDHVPNLSKSFGEIVVLRVKTLMSSGRTVLVCLRFLTPTERFVLLTLARGVKRWKIIMLAIKT